MKTLGFLITTVLFYCYYHHYYRYHNSALSDDAGWDRAKRAHRLTLPGNKSLLWPGDFGTSSTGMLSDGWHPRRVGLGQLVPVRSIQPHRLEIVVVVAPDNDLAQLGGGPTTTTPPPPPAPVLAKLAASPGDLAALAREATMYRRLYDVGVTPRFLGHVTDEAQGGRIVGFLTEYIPPPPPSSSRGNNKSSSKAEACLAALRRAHARGIAHGDAHGGNCLARGDGSGSAVLIDFELALETGAQAEFDRDLWIMAHTADD